MAHEAPHSGGASSFSPTPAMKADMTRNSLSGEEMNGVIERAAASTKGMEDLLDGKLLLNNGKRLELNTVEEARLLIEYGETAIDKTLLGHGPETFVKVMEDNRELMRYIGEDSLRSMAAVDRSMARKAAARLLMYKEVMVSSLEEMVDIGRQISVHGKTPELAAKLDKASRLFQDMQLTAKDMGTGAARTTSAGRITPKYLDGDLLMDIAARADGNLERAMRSMNLANISGLRRGGRLLTEYIINGLLSSPKTHLVNVSGNFMKSLTMPVETMLGGVMMGDKQLVHEGAATFHGVFKYLGESWEAAKQAFKSGDNILDAGHQIRDISHQPVLSTYTKNKNDILMRMQAMGQDISQGLSPLQELQVSMQAWLGSIVAAPSRALLTMDEYFKQINYRARLYGKAVAEGSLDPAMRGDARALAEYADSQVRRAFDEAGRGTDAAGLRYGQEATWTQPLRDGAHCNFGQGFTKLAEACPPMRLVMPFIRTPTNLIRDFVAHTPGLNFATKRFQDAWRAGGEERARALGQIATGGMLWVSAINLATSGRMTGGYPKDAATRQAWMDAGIEPYSFKVGDTYISFARLDPFSTLFGIAADYAEYSRNWNDAAKGNWASGAVVALASNLTSKSYLTGMMDVMAALSDDSTDSKKMQKYLQRSATMLLPYSSGLRFARQWRDDPMREVRTTWDAILNAIPGASELLPVRYSWISGKPNVQNLIYGENTDDTVMNELVRLGDNMHISAPQKTLKGVELDGNQYSRLCELQGTIKIGGLTQHERLEKLMASKAYDMERRRIADMPGDEQNPRTVMVGEVISAYRSAAQNALLREDKALVENIGQMRLRKQAAMRGDTNTYNELLTMPKK